MRDEWGVPERSGTPRSPFPRRTFLIGSLASGLLGLAACAAPGGADTSVRAPEASSTPSTPRTRDDLFYIAHRGSGDNWTEHTIRAYLAAEAAGATDIEISVQTTRDGVLVCHHDDNLKRLTGLDREIDSLDWAELADVRNDARAWLGPSTPLEPIPRLEDVFTALSPSTTLWVEDKQGRSTTQLLDLLDATGGPERYVWKQWAGAGQYAAARKRNYRCWGYFDSGSFDRVSELADRFEMVGVPVGSTDDEIAAVVASGKPVVAWEVHRRSERDRLAALGVTGLMCSNYPYVTSAGCSTMRDAFASGRRAAGDLPFSTVGWSGQPRFVTEEAAIRLSGAEPQSYLLGSLSPVGSSSYRVSFDARWPDALPSSDQHLGMAIGQDSDAPYRIGSATTTAGYHLVSRANGILELFWRESGADSGTSLARTSGAPAIPGDWFTVTIDVGPSSIRVSRSDGATVRAAVTAAPGPYVSLLTGYADGPDADFRAVRVDL